MSQQKLTIALIGEDEARKHAKSKIIKFSQTYNSKNKSEAFKSNSIAENSSSILEDFLFEGYEVNIVDVTRLDEGLPEFDGAILTHMVSRTPSETLATKINPPKSNNQSREERCLIDMDSLTEAIPEGKEWIVSDAHEDPYFCLAEKIGCIGDRIQRLYLYPTEKISIPSASQEFESIESLLKEFIRVKKFLLPFKTLLNNKQDETEKLTEDSVSWYKKNQWLILSVVSLGIISALLFTGFALTGLVLTPFIAIPITLLVSGVLISIKIAYDNRLRMSVSSIPHSSTIFGLDSIKQVQQTFDPSYSDVVQTNRDSRATNLQFANDAATKLRTMLANNNEPNKRSQVKIIFSLENNGQFFINCSNSNPRCNEAQVEFENFEKTLKGLLGNDIALNHIPITKILDLPGETFNQLKSINPTL